MVIIVKEERFRPTYGNKLEIINKKEELNLSNRQTVEFFKNTKNWDFSQASVSIWCKNRAEIESFVSEGRNSINKIKIPDTEEKLREYIILSNNSGFYLTTDLIKRKAQKILEITKEVP